MHLSSDSSLLGFFGFFAEPLSNFNVIFEDGTVVNVEAVAIVDDVDGTIVDVEAVAAIDNVGSTFDIEAAAAVIDSIDNIGSFAGVVVSDIIGIFDFADVAGFDDVGVGAFDDVGVAI
ncbi:hypothetical protein F8M41_019533 [Gigaspora margarita]|uniref:Uncharacterized protein n=1 Tax=Gigaspora margarita TaxID=4874 RepID=A0A8H4AJZ0_GIGMA|nr:hypothetical protein F8M41_019533 [Gigaspora margarita]